MDHAGPVDQRAPARAKRYGRRQILRRSGQAGALGLLSLVALPRLSLAAPASAPGRRSELDVATAAAPSGGNPMYQVDAQHSGRSAYAGPRQAVVARAFDMAASSQAAPGQAAPRIDIQSSSAVGADGTIYIADFPGDLFALSDPGSGSALALRWKFHPGGSSLHATPAVGSDGTVYLGFSTLGQGARKATLYALKAPVSGTEPTTAWSVDLGEGAVSSSPTIGPDGSIYAVNGAGKLFVVAPDGGVQWTAQAGPTLRSAPALGTDGTVYMACTDGKLYAVAPPSGGGDRSVRWSSDTMAHLGPTPLLTKAPPPQGADGKGIISSPTVGPDGTIYLGGANSNFYAIGPDGQMKWLYEAERELAGIASTAALSADGKTLYFGANKGCIYALATADGSLQWRFDIFGSVYSSPMLDSKGVLYTDSTVGHMYAIDTSSGQAVFDADAGGPVWTTPSILPNGSLVVATRGSRVVLYGGMPSNLPTTGGGGGARE